MWHTDRGSWDIVTQEAQSKQHAESNVSISWSMSLNHVLSARKNLIQNLWNSWWNMGSMLRDWLLIRGHRAGANGEGGCHFFHVPPKYFGNLIVFILDAPRSWILATPLAGGALAKVFLWLIKIEVFEQTFLGYFSFTFQRKTLHNLLN